MSTRWRASTSIIARSWASRRGKVVCSKTTVSTCRSAAALSPGAPFTFEMTTAGSAGTRPARIASISATMFEPRPEIRIPTRGGFDSGIDHVANARDDGADLEERFTRARQVRFERRGVFRGDHADHAHPHV